MHTAASAGPEGAGRRGCRIPGVRKRKTWSTQEGTTEITENMCNRYHM